MDSCLACTMRGTECTHQEELAAVREWAVSSLEGDPWRLNEPGPDVTDTFTCEWLVATGKYNEDGESIIVECGAQARSTERGWSCVSGHSHVYPEYRAAEGWDYATDRGEADQLTKHGTFPFLMDGTGPF